MALVVVILGAFKDAMKDCVKWGTTCKCHHNGVTFDMNGIDGDCSVIGDIHGLATGILILMVFSIIVLFAGSILGCVAVCCNKVDIGFINPCFFDDLFNSQFFDSNTVPNQKFSKSSVSNKVGLYSI